MGIGDTLGAFGALTIGMFTATVTFVFKYFIIKKIESSMVLRQHQEQVTIKLLIKLQNLQLATLKFHKLHSEVKS